MKGEIQLALGAIVMSVHEPREHISPIFVSPKRPKDDGADRLILNLKKLTEATE